MDNLIMCTEPNIDKTNRKIITQHLIDTDYEITISVNEDILLDKSDIEEIDGNEITIVDLPEINMDIDKFIVIYSKL